MKATEINEATNATFEVMSKNKFKYVFTFWVQIR